MTDEVFKIIEGCPNYMISSKGRVYNHKRGKFLALDVAGNGYVHVHMNVGGVRKHGLIHRLVAEAFIPNREGKSDVNHKDEDKTNNDVSNLEWMTRQENSEYSNAKHYTFISPTGVVTEVFNLNKFCKENALCVGHMSKVHKGQRRVHKGWTI